MGLHMGIDPDMHRMSVAVVDDEGIPQYLEVLRVEDKFKEEDALLAGIITFGLWSKDFSWPIESIAIEGQQIYQKGQDKTKSPIGMMNLRGAACAMAMRLHMLYPEADMRLPLPQEWKGSVPKQIHQAKLCTAMGWDYKKVGEDPKKGYCIPTDPPQEFKHIVKSDWKHLLDAIGLARWSAKAYHDFLLFKSKVAALDAAEAPKKKKVFFTPGVIAYE